jgi:hypothetical protein
LIIVIWSLFRRGVRVVEGARLESVCTPKVYPGFESQSLRKVGMSVGLRAGRCECGKYEWEFISEGMKAIQTNS